MTDQLGADDGTDTDNDADTSGEQASRQLSALAPGYDETAHKEYVDHLIAALADDQIRNIALTGGYGAGKSSVLAGLTSTLEDGRLGEGPAPVTLSLSALEGHSSNAPPSPDAASGSEDEQTTHQDQYARANQIAKALVTQLLYVRKPTDVPESRYPRTQPYPRKFAWWTSAALGVAGTTWMSLAGWDPLTFPDDLLSVETLKPLALGLLTAGGLTGGTYGVRVLLKRYAIASVAAGGATLSLTERSDDYLDEFLDEIVYFFQTTGTRIVIFEDLDRFDNPAIFEQLRELNTVLNSAAQIKQTVRFIYAIRDSVFERLAASTDSTDDDSTAHEMERANRTKFFDLVVPIVPFITHKNARDLMTQELDTVTAALGKAVQVPPNVIGLVARHFTDMRAIKNLCNEYQIFANDLLVREGGVLDLEPSALFAMVAYKCLHPRDFELVLRGQSKLDRIYTTSRELIAAARLKAERDLRTITERGPREHRRQALADELKQRLQGLIEVMSHRDWRTADLGDKTFGGDDIGTPAFWDALLHPDAGQITVQPRVGGTVSLSATSVARLLGAATTWPQTDDDRPPQDQIELEDKIAILRAADMKEILTLPTLIGGDTETSPFGAAIDKVGVSAMARDLIGAGHINRYFGLYVGRFHETTLSKVTVAYIHRHVDQATFDPTYPFENPANIAGLLDEPGAESMGVSAYNVEIVDYLFTKPHELRRTLAKDLAAGGDDADTFLTTYWSSGTHTKQLAALMARHDEDLLTKITQRWDLTEEQQLTLVDVCVTAATPLALRVDDNVRDLLETSYQLMEAFKTPQPTSVRQRIVDLLDFPIPDLSDVHDDLRSDLVAADQYTLTRDNLQAARNTLRLSELTAGDAVFDRCLRELPTYLTIATANPNDATIHDKAAIHTLLDYLASDADDPELDHDAASQLIAAITPTDAFIEDLATYPPTFWAALVENQRVTLSAYNLHTYLTDDERTVDAHVQAWIGDQPTITAPPPTDPDNPLYVDDVARTAVAIAILNAADHLPEPEQRVTLATSLVEAGDIDPVAITPEKGELLALLLKNRALDNEKAAVRHFLTQCHWSTISTAAQHLQTPTVIVDIFNEGTIPTDQIPDVLSSNLPDEVVPALLTALPDRVSADDPAANPVYQAAAQAAATALNESPQTRAHAHASWLTPILISRLISAGVDDTTIVSLIPSIEGITEGDLRGMLRSLRPPYDELATSGATIQLDDNDLHEKLRTYLHKQKILQGPGRRLRTKRKQGKVEVHVR